MNASDPANALLNYGYAILESECRKAVNSVGLEPTVGFLHEARQTKYPLVYDLMEPYRFLVDTTIVECLDSQKFTKKDFYRTDNYVLRLRPEAACKMVDALRTKINSTVRYSNRFYGWDTVIRLKLQELGNFIQGKGSDLSFDEPPPILSRQASTGIRNRIVSLKVAEARSLGIGKSTLRYLQKRVRTGKPLKTYRPILNKLQN